MKRLVAAVAAAAAVLAALTGCGGTDDTESVKPITHQIDSLRAEIKMESKAVAAHDADAKDHIQSVKETAAYVTPKLADLAKDAPADTRDFANAAHAWAEAVLTSRTAILEQADADTSTAALANVGLAARTLDQDAKHLGVKGWENVHDL
ncbi:hypothetical protein [Streptomyces sp. NBC_00986]|uniref:hypothetical protein n=1 Tax=Streptomyces sp. NBC_00986 TaxID=2903702 RepID=UPI0038661053|nr:hypothetical protein OG504_20260 [Streptomyces sp. NBC_00986]